LSATVPPGPARDVLAEIIKNALRNPTEIKNLTAVSQMLLKNDELLQTLIKNPEALEAVLRYGPDAVILAEKFGEQGLELLTRGTLTPSDVAKISELPLQTHHMAAWKNDIWTPRFKGIFDKYDLNINGSWNKIDIYHKGSHAPQYHEWVFEELKDIDATAQGDTAEFLRLYKIQIKQVVEANPLMVRTEWYK
jgi:hypothetical protein